MTGRRDGVLEGLAGNPAAPSSVLLRLLGVEDIHHIVRIVVWRKDLPQDVVDAVVTHPDRRIRSLYGESGHADPEQRARLLDGHPGDAFVLAHGPMMYRATAPPLPDWAYERLLDHPREHVRYELVRFGYLPPHIAVTLADHEEWSYRVAACRAWDALPEAARRSLLDDEDDDVRTAAALHVFRGDEELTTELVGRLRGDGRLGEVLESGALTREVAQRMVAERPWIAKLALNPTLPADLVAKLAVDDDPSVRLAVSARPGLTEEERAAIDHAVDPEDRLDTLRWVWDARDDPEVLRRCATSAHVWLRRSAAVCRGLPDDMVELLSGDEDFAVRLLLAEYHPAAPAELLLDLWLHGSHRAVGMLIAKPQFPSAGLAARFNDAADPRARALVVRDPDATPAQIDRLSRDPVAAVRAKAARDPRLALTRVRELLAEPETLHAAAASPRLGAGEMHALLDEVGVPRQTGRMSAGPSSP
ncbi:hypothetical protein ACWGJT_35955 [Streptomyces xantholiticus]